MKKAKLVMGVLACAGVWVNVVRAEEAPSLEAMWAIIQEQQREIAALKAELASTREEVTEAKAEVAQAREEVTEVSGAMSETREQVEATALAVEEQGAGARSGLAGWAERTQVGGYGELHANFIEGGEDQIDLHRFVLSFSHDFTDRIHFFSEFEFEHAALEDTADGSSDGEVKIEQAYIRFDLNERWSVDTGMFLMPVGILSEKHEPATFYGVERNRVEVNIIPTSWSEAGVLAKYRLPSGWSFDAGVSSGLDLGSSGRIRSARQKVAEAIFEEVAVMARAKYTGIAGVELAASVLYQNDMAQSAAAEIPGMLTEVHADIQRGGFGFRALYARWDIDNDNGFLPASAEEQYGFYLEPSYRFRTDLGEVGVFFRYSNFEFQRSATSFYEDEIYTLGVNYWPTGNVVLKADYQDTSESRDLSGDSRINLGVGYHF